MFTHYKLEPENIYHTGKKTGIKISMMPVQYYKKN